jgi:C-terminal processing protease CtpA/Prc
MTDPLDKGWGDTSAVQEMVLPVSSTGLGLTFVGGGVDPVVVNEVDELGIAGLDGRLRPGDILLAVDGHALSGLPPTDVLRLLSTARGTEADFATIELHAHGGGLGLTLEGGADTAEGPPVRIKSIIPGGAAAQDGRLQPGMALLGLDEFTLTGRDMSGERAKTLLSLVKLHNKQGPTVLRVARRCVTLRYRPAVTAAAPTAGIAAMAQADTPLTNSAGEMIFPVQDLLKVRHCATR